MKLKKYLLKYRIEPDEFAVNANISISSIYRYLSGKKMHLRTAKHIEKLTEGEVSVEELLNLDVR